MVTLPKNVSSMKNTTVAVRLTTSSRTSRPPRAKCFLRLSPVPVFAPTARGAPLASTKAPRRRCRGAGFHDVDQALTEDRGDLRGEDPLGLGGSRRSTVS